MHRNKGLEEVELKDTVTNLRIQSALEAHFIFLLPTLIFYNLFGTSLNGLWKHAWCYCQLPFHTQNRHIGQNNSILSSKLFLYCSKIGVSNNNTCLRSVCSFPSTITSVCVLSLSFPHPICVCTTLKINQNLTRLLEGW